MRSICRTVAIAAAGMLLVPQLAAASDLEAEVADMKQRMERMEGELRAQKDDLAAAEATVEEQNQVIAAAGLEEREDVSALSVFIEQVDFSAWVAASYNYNFTSFNDSALAAGAANNGIGGVYPGYGQHVTPNTFQLDQAWLSIDKAPTEESRAGAHFDFVSGDGFTLQGGTAGTNSVAVYSAYVSYLVPLFSGIQIDAGILPTALGAEVEQTNGNFQVTRGFMWGLQPVTSTGITATMDITDGFSFMVGLLNDPFSRVPLDGNNGKAVTTQIGYSAEKWGAAVGLNYGRSTGAPGLNGGTNASFGLLDVLLSADPTDNLSVWVNYDYHFQKNFITAGVGTAGPTADTTAHVVAVAGRLGVLDATGISLRYEFGTLSDDTPTTPGATIAGIPGTDLHSVTVTLDHGLTDNLTAKLEGRYDRSNQTIFPGETLTTLPKNQQGVILAQMIYEF